MKSNNELLGNHIIQCINMNKDMVTENLLGVNIDKNFMPSVANIVGTDLTTYKIIANNTFACNPMHVGRDKKLPVSLYKSKTPSIVSPAYYTFKIANETKLNPEYLMLLFRQDKFDRQCWFYTDSSVRGGLSWEDFCRIEIPVPPIEQQKKIVQTYNTLTKRIELKKQINEKLEAIAQAVYKHWFEDFEFPITEEYAKIINRPDLIGKPYKSSGGEMIYSEELDKYIPNGWELKGLDNIVEFHDYKRIPLSSVERAGMEKKYPYYGAASLIDYVDNYIFDGTYILLGEDGTVVTDEGKPVVQYVTGKFWVNNHAHILTGYNGFDNNSIYILLKNIRITEYITGGVQAKLSQTSLSNIKILYSNLTLLSVFNHYIMPLFQKIIDNNTEISLIKQHLNLIIYKLNS